MDYGKLAYLKAEELEARLGTDAAAAKPKYSCEKVAPLLELVEGREIYLTQISSSGATALFVKLTCVVQEKGRVELLVGNLSIGSAIFGEVGKECEGVVVASVLVEDSQSVSIRALEGFCGIVKLAEILACGDNACVGKRVSSFTFDGSGDGFSAVLPINETVYFSYSDSEAGVCKAERKVLGRGSKCDVIGYGGGFKIIYADNHDNLWGISYENSKFSERVFLGSYPLLRKVRIAIYNDRILIALLIGADVCCMLADSGFFGRTAVESIQTHVRTEDIGFVKGGGGICMFYYGEGKSFLKTIEEEKCGTENIAVSVSLTVEAGT